MKFSKFASVLFIIAVLIASLPQSAAADTGMPRYYSGRYECKSFTCPSYDVSTGKSNGFVFSGTKLTVKRFFAANVKKAWTRGWTRVTLGQSYLGPVGGDCFDMSNFVKVQ